MIKEKHHICVKKKKKRKKRKMSENINPNPEKELLKFVPFSSCLNPSFWFELNRVKLDDYKLNDDFKSLTGFYNHCWVLPFKLFIPMSILTLIIFNHLFPGSRNDLPPIMNFDFSSFQELVCFFQVFPVVEFYSRLFFCRLLKGRWS